VRQGRAQLIAPASVSVSIVTPAFNEAESLPLLYARLKAALDPLAIDWEWIVVDDHSRDGTVDVVERLASDDRRVRGIRFARNAGSHSAIACGLHHAAGASAVMLAADLQDPPEVIPRLMERWQAGAQVVWAARRGRPGDRAHVGFAALYYWIMRRVSGLSAMPARGADCFLADRVVLDAFARLRERPVSVLALITWLGFRQETIEYDKHERQHGRSGWTLRKKVALVVESIVAFSDLPIRLCAWAGVLCLGVAVTLPIAGLFLQPSLGWSVLFAAAAFVGLAGVQLLSAGVLGAYLWRALEESRGRPPYVIERVVGSMRTGEGADTVEPVGRGGIA